MNELQKVFQYKGSNVRTVVRDGEPWFVAKDVCEILEIDNPAQALARLDDDERSTIILNEGIGNPHRSTVNEPGLYSLILGSRKKEAKKFKRWITHEVLPSIRKTGVYVAPQVDSKMLYQIAQTLEAKEREIETMKPKALFAEAVTASKSSILVGELAKILRQNGVDIGQNRLFGWMRSNGYLCSKGESFNLPTQRAMDLEVCDIKKTTINKPDGSSFVTRTTKITGKGQVYFVNKFL